MTTENINDAIRKGATDQAAMESGRAGWDRSEYGDGGYETGFSAGGVQAWHGLATVRLEEYLTTDEAIIAAGLDWDVLRVPLSEVMPGQPGAERFVANVRSTDRRILGVTSPGYKPVQNRAKFAFMDELLGGAAHYETGGSLDNGAKVFLLARIHRDIKIAGLTDETIACYLLLSDGHDGRGSLTGSLTGVRVQCRNSNTLAISGAPRKFTLRHTSSIEGRMAEARQTLGIATRYFDGLEKLGNELVGQKMSRREVDAFLSNLVEFIPPKGADLDSRAAKSKLKARDAVLAILANKPDLQDIKGTRWGVLQAIVDWDDHSRPVRETKVATGAEQRFIRATGFADTDSASIKNRALVLLTR